MYKVQILLTTTGQKVKVQYCDIIDYRIYWNKCKFIMCNSDSVYVLRVKCSLEWLFLFYNLF